MSVNWRRYYIKEGFYIANFTKAFLKYLYKSIFYERPGMAALKLMTKLMTLTRWP